MRKPIKMKAYKAKDIRFTMSDAQKIRLEEILGEFKDWAESEDSGYDSDFFEGYIRALDDLNQRLLRG